MLGHALDIATALQRDQHRSISERHARDRAIAQAEGLLPLSNARRAQLQAVRTWWRAAAKLPSFRSLSEELNGRSLDRARAAGTVLLLLFGALLGMAVTTAALHYDGSAPVNLVTVLGVLVVVPLFMLALTLLLLPGRVRGLRWLQDVLATVSPGQWFSAWLNRRYVNADLGWRGRFSRSAALADAAPAGYRTVAKWQLLFYAQMLAIGFFLASLCTTVLLVSFSDLAFGWSTTLDVQESRVVSWVTTITAPWASWLPVAVPDPELIGESRFYRAARLSPAQVEGLGDWWPFLLATIATYGLLPRLLLAAVSLTRLRRAEQQLLLNHPQVKRLLERMATPVIGHAVDVAEAEETSPALGMAQGDEPANATAQYLLPEGRFVLINWNGAVDDSTLSLWAAAHLPRSPSMSLALSTQLDLTAEQEVLSRLSADVAVVLTKAWEPPLLEFIDFAQRLKDSLDNQGPVLIVPVGIDANPPTPEDWAIWHETLARIDDVRVRLAEPVT